MIAVATFMVSCGESTKKEESCDSTKVCCDSNVVVTDSTAVVSDSASTVVDSTQH